MASEGNGLSRAAAVGLAQQPRLEDHLRQLLDEERHAVGLADDVLDDLGRQRAPAREARHHALGVRARETPERDVRHVRARAPRESALGTAGEEHQDARRRPLVDAQPEELEGRRVDPVEVVDEEHERTIGGEPQKQREDDLERPLAAALRGHLERRMSMLVGQRQELREQRHRFRGGDGEAREHPLEPCEPLVGGVVAIPAEQPLEELDHWEERAVGVVRGPAAFEPGMRLARDALAEDLHQTGLPDARLAADEHDLTDTVLHLLPPVEEETRLLLAADEPREAAGDGDLETASRSRLSEQAVRAHRRRESLQALRAQVRDREEAARERVRRLAHDHRVGLRERLQPRGDVGRLADDADRSALVRRAELADDDQPAVHPDADRERRPALALELQVEVPDSLQDAERRAHGTLRVVLVGARIPEVQQDAVAEVQPHVPVEARRHADAHPLVAPHHVAQRLGVEPLGQRGRADEVREHDRHVAALGLREPRTAGAAEGGIGRALAATAGAAHRRSAHRFHAVSLK